MSTENKSLGPSTAFEKCSVVLVDVLGTTTSINFAKVRKFYFYSLLTIRTGLATAIFGHFHSIYVFITEKYCLFSRFDCLSAAGYEVAEIISN